MKMPWISIAGLYAHYSDIFDNLVIPTAADYADMPADLLRPDPFVPIKADLINYICMQLAELPMVYQDPESVKLMIGYWSKAQLPAWVEIWRTLLYKYNPIWNKDGEVQEQRDITFKRAGNTTDTGTVGRSGSSSGSAENQVTGFDTNAYSPNKKDITSGSASETTTNNLAGHSYEDGESHDTFGRWERGNIGVTSSQQLIEEQRKLASFSFYDFLTDAFKNQFCVMVW